MTARFANAPQQIIVRVRRECVPKPLTIPGRLGPPFGEQLTRFASRSLSQPVNRRRRQVDLSSDGASHSAEGKWFRLAAITLRPVLAAQRRHVSAAGTDRPDKYGNGRDARGPPDGMTIEDRTRITS